MGKGLGKLQLCVMRELSENNNRKKSSFSQQFYFDVMEAYFGEVPGRPFQWRDVYMWSVYDDDKKTMNKYRASIGQAILSLKRRRLIGKYMDVFFLTPKGIEYMNSVWQRENQQKTN